jgi:type II secretory pathway pseudopilin PulG
MAFCAWCGNQVPQVSYAPCPRCGNPTNGSQRVAGAANAGSKTAGVVIGVIVGGLVVVAFIGIFAAIAIPNFLTAMQRARQKRTMADMRSVASAVESYASQENHYPDASELSSALVPKYIKVLPSQDGWTTPLRYECWPAGQCTMYGIASAGADKTFEHDSIQEYATDTKTVTFDNDIVFANGRFAQYPEGVQH